MSDVIRDLHDSEINGEISWFFDGCWRVRLGDAWSGWNYRVNAASFEEATEKLTEAALRLYPQSEFAKKYSRVARVMATTVPVPPDRPRDEAALWPTNS